MEQINAQIKNYLLGNLDEKGNEEIGLKILSDSIAEEEFLIAENDLIEDFLEKNLSNEEEKLFYENFLICEGRQEKIREIYLFKKYVKMNFQTGTSFESGIEQSATFWEKIKNLFKPDMRLAVPLLSVLIIALALGIVWRIFLSDRQIELTTLEQEYAELNRQEFDDPAQVSGLSKVELIGGTFRDSGAAKVLKLESLSDRIFFRLALPPNSGENNLLKAELVKDQKTIFTQPQIGVYKNPNGQEIRLILPKSVLSKGQYQIKIEDSKTNETPFIYGFAVE